jgi:hypothetical protein
LYYLIPFNCKNKINNYKVHSSINFLADPLSGFTTRIRIHKIPKSASNPDFNLIHTAGGPKEPFYFESPAFPTQ